LDAFFEHATADGFDADKTFDHRLPIFWLRRGEAQTTVTDHHRSDAVKAGRGAQGIPKQLGVEMRVRVNKAWRQSQAIEVECLIGAAGYPSDLNDLPTRDADIAVKAWHTRTVINPAILEHEVIHCTLLSSTPYTLR